MSQKIEIPHEAIVKYVERRKKDLLDCQRAATEKDYQSIARLGHQIKGNASTFGFDELAQIAIEMEDSALRSDSKKLETTLGQFAQFLNQIEI